MFLYSHVSFLFEFCFYVFYVFGRKEHTLPRIYRRMHTNIKHQRLNPDMEEPNILMVRKTPL